MSIVTCVYTIVSTHLCVRKHLIVTALSRSQSYEAEVQPTSEERRREHGGLMGSLLSSRKQIQYTCIHILNYSIRTFVITNRNNSKK